MAEEKMTKEKLLAKRREAVFDEWVSRHPWMSRDEAIEALRVSELPDEEQRIYYEQKALAELKQSLLDIEGVDEALAEFLTQGGVKAFHTVASGLTYEIFHEVAHKMIGNPAGGC